MFDRLFYRFRLWSSERPVAFRAVIALGCLLVGHQIFRRLFEGEFTMTLGDLALIVTGSLSTAFKTDEPPEPPRPWVPRPEDMSILAFWVQKAGRYVLAAALITLVVWAVDPIVEGDGDLGSKAHLTALVLFLWPVGCALPFWQPNREPRPKREPLPPLPPTLRLPRGPDRTA